MDRFVSEQLMTVAEAERLSRLQDSHDRRDKRPGIWAWQSVAAVLAQTLSEQQLDQVMRKSRRTRA